VTHAGAADRVCAREHGGPEPRAATGAGAGGSRVYGHGLREGYHTASATALLTFVREGDTVVVHSMDRLARNLDDLRRLVQLLTRGMFGMSVIFPCWGSVQQSSPCWTVKPHFEVFPKQ
jgi:hypothetical protein